MNNLDKALKIGKQVMKTQITAELTKAKEDLKAVDKEFHHHENHWKKPAKAFFQHKVDLYLANDSELNTVFNFLKTYTYRIQDTDFALKDMLEVHLPNSVFACQAFINPPKHLIKLRETGQCKASVELRVDVLDREGYHGKPSFEIPIDLSEDLLRCLDQTIEFANKQVEINNRLAELNDQLNNLDEYLEEMEANLLVQELQATEVGASVLKLTTEIVSGVTGNTPKLLGGSRD